MVKNKLKTKKDIWKYTHSHDEKPRIPKKRIIIGGVIMALVLGGGVAGASAINTKIGEVNGTRPLHITQVDEIGRKQEAELKASGIPLEGETLTQFSDGRSDEIARELVEEMKKSNSGKLTKYEFEYVASAKQVINCVAFEYLCGATAPVEIYRSGDKFVIGWSNSDEVFRQNLIGETFMANFYAEHEDEISALKTDKEKADKIAKLICDNLVQKYDNDYQVRTIYEFQEAGTNVGVCTVYTTMMDRLCEYAGIQSYMEIGVLKRDDTGTHCWNKLVFSDGSIHYYDLTSYNSVRNTNFIDMPHDYYNEQYGYRKLEKTEFGYKAGVNTVDVDIEDEWF